MPLILHFYFIDLATKQRMYVLRTTVLDPTAPLLTPDSHSRFSRNVLILHLSAFCEISIAALVTLFTFSDSWLPTDIKSCPVERLSDWYTVFHNPAPNYGDKLHCTHEAVYPL